MTINITVKENKINNVKDPNVSSKSIAVYTLG